MRKIIIILAVLIMAASVYAEDHSYFCTGGFTNGRGFSSDNEFIKNDTENYALGCIDALYSTHYSEMNKLYPNATKKDIIEAIKLYYQNNPDKQSKPIIKVIMEGWKKEEDPGLPKFK